MLLERSFWVALEEPSPYTAFRWIPGLCQNQYQKSCPLLWNYIVGILPRCRQPFKQRSMLTGEFVFFGKPHNYIIQAPFLVHLQSNKMFDVSLKYWRAEYNAWSSILEDTMLTWTHWLIIMLFARFTDRVFPFHWRANVKTNLELIADG